MILGGEKSLFTVDIHKWLWAFRQNVCALTAGEDGVAKPTFHVRATPQCLRPCDVTILSSATMAKSAIDDRFYCLLFGPNDKITWDERNNIWLSRITMFWSLVRRQPTLLTRYCITNKNGWLIAALMTTKSSFTGSHIFSCIWYKRRLVFKSRHRWTSKLSLQNNKAFTGKIYWDMVRAWVTHKTMYVITYPCQYRS